VATHGDPRASLSELAPTPPMPGVFMTCTATYGSGAVTGTIAACRGARTLIFPRKRASVTAMARIPASVVEAHGSRMAGPIVPQCVFASSRNAAVTTLGVGRAPVVLSSVAAASARRMSRMIEQILDFTRSRLGGGLALAVVPVDLREALSAIVEELRAAHPAATIQLQCPELRGTWDRDRLEQVFSNLIGNALAHGDPGKPITVTAGTEPLGVWVQVHNEGPPIPHELQSELFNPFRKSELASRSPAALGLGLYISSEVIARHGGQITVRSSAVEGTTFRVVLPREVGGNSGDRGSDP